MDIQVISVVSGCILILMLQYTTIYGIQYSETDKLVKEMISSGNISMVNTMNSTIDNGAYIGPGPSVCNTGYSNSTLSEIIHSIPADIQCNTERTVIFAFDETHVLDGWESIVILKSKAGYHLDQIIPSGIGSVGNPTRFYALMSK